MKQKDMYLVALALVVGYFVILPQIQGPGGGVTLPVQTGTQPSNVINIQETCPSSSTNVAASYKNALNDASDERANTTLYLYTGSAIGGGSYVTSLTDTDSTPSTYAANCGQEYNARIVSGETNTAADVSLGKVVGSAIVAPIVQGAQHADTKVRVWDVKGAQWLKESGANETDYTVANLTYGNATSGNSAMQVGTDGDIKYRMDFRATATDAQFGDTSTIVCEDYNLTGWQTPTLEENGVVLTASREYTMSSQMVADGYDKCYRLSAPVKGKSDTSITLNAIAKSGVNPTDDIKVALLSAGSYMSIDGVTIKTDSVNKDDSSYTYVHNPNIVTLDLS